MPCFSSVKTKMTNAKTLTEALSKTGHVVSGDDREISAEKNGNRINFSFSGGVFNASGDTKNLSDISVAYAGIGVRQWAKTRGFSVEKSEGRKLTLVRR